MSIHIGDFWQNKQNKNVIYHVDNYAFEMSEYNDLTNSMMVICTKIYINSTRDEEPLLQEDPFFIYAKPDDFKHKCELILSAKRITKDRRFKTDQDIINYLIEKVGEQNGK